MPSQARRTSFPKVVIERDADSEESSSEEEVEDDDVQTEEEEVEEEEEEVAEEPENVVKIEVVSGSKKRERAPITISLKKVCKVRLI